MRDSQITELRFPAKLRPTSQTEKVSVSVDFTVTRDLSREQIKELTTVLGLVHVNAQYLKPLRSQGCGAEQIGVMTTSRGGVLLTQAALLQAIGICNQIVASPEEINVKSPNASEPPDCWGT